MTFDTVCEVGTFSEVCSIRQCIWGVAEYAWTHCNECCERQEGILFFTKGLGGIF